SGSFSGVIPRSCVAMARICHGAVARSSRTLFVTVFPLCSPRRQPFAPGERRCLVMRRELRLDHGPGRKLALAHAASGHSGARPHQAEVAAHEAARALEVGEDLTAIMGDGVHGRSPRTPAAPTPAPWTAAKAAAPTPAGTPAVPQRVIVDHAFRGDLEEGALEDLTVCQTGDHRAASPASLSPNEGGAQIASGRLPGPHASRRAAGYRNREKRRRRGSNR